MPPNMAPLDSLNLLFLPLMAVTVVQLLRGWKNFWDEDFTAYDRQLAQRVVLFLLLPLVVLCHELGHVAAVKYFGGTVREFHYAFLSGYVVPGEQFGPNETVWLYFSGNLVQILIGLGAGLAALLVSSPPAVALLAYLALWSVGGTVIVYALLSVTGLYGDWVNIYTSEFSPSVLAIACFHAFCAALVVWCLYADRPRLWFTRKTNPGWAGEYDSLESCVRQSPSAENWLNLGWSLYRKELYRKSGECLAAARKFLPEAPAVIFLEAAIAEGRQKSAQAVKCYQRLLSQPQLSDNTRLLALNSLGQCLARQRRTQEALTTFNQACLAAPEIADPHYLKAMLLYSDGRLEEAERELLEACRLNWLDRSLADNAARQLLLIRRRYGKQ
jgi:hypothetical protein